ncbi:unnamed protein product [Acanthoscelides obtectus]|nr:unnamed protein product [Acanthoscelides obtectus]CAK1655733.1 Terminal uridylyltransferase Tailor [Acanthoscelides obtectus]
MMLSTDNAISLLENGLLGVPRFNLAEAKKVSEVFRNLLISCRMSMSTVKEVDCVELDFILRDIKKQITEILKENEGKQMFISNYYKCSKCDVIIYTDDKKNVWEYLQCHSHFEDMYCEALTYSTEFKTEGPELSLNDSNIENMTDIEEEKSNLSDSEIHVDTTVVDMEIDMNDVGSSGVLDENGPDNDVNSFRFNFDLHYDETISSKLYPQGLEKAVQKIDRCKDPTIQRISGSRVVCLLCGVNINSRTRISKAAILDHVMGQKHLGLSFSEQNIDALRRYHELWLNFDCNYQAHQVFFLPRGYSLACRLCKTMEKACVKYDYTIVRNHIDSETHKNRLIKITETNPKLYYLAYEQAQVYNMSNEEMDKMFNLSTDGKSKKKSEKQHNKNSDSDSSISADPSNEVTSKAKSEKGNKLEIKSHNIIKSVGAEGSNHVLDLLPNRFKNHHLFLLVTADGIQCKACDVTLNKDVDVVRKHIKNLQHYRMTGLKPEKYDYYCEICNIKIEAEDLWQKHFEIGPNNHINMAESRKPRVTEYECTVCNTVIFGDELSLARHLSVKSGKKKKQQKEMKLPDAVKKMFLSKEFINFQSRNLTNAANQTAESSDCTHYCCERLEAALSTFFPDCKAFPFGSRISGLGHAFSDLDIFIDTGNMYTGTKNQDTQSQATIVRKVANLLGKSKLEFQDISRIVGARTPIVQVFHAPTNIDCDLSFKHGLSVENTNFLRFCIDLQPITQPLILIIKEWSEMNNFKEHDHVSNYALSMMVIFYLQTERHLLSIKKLRELNKGSNPVINGWEAVSYKIPLSQMLQYVKPCDKSITELLKDFFNYYSTFHYDTDVVCPLLGHTVRKTVFENTSCLPPEMKSYVNKLQSGDPELFRYTSSFCVQDPFDLSHNLSKAWTSATVNKFKALCNLSVQHLDTL